MNYGEDEWFTYDNNEEFNKQAESPGAAGQYFEPGNIDNIPLNDDAADPLDFNAIDEYQYNDQLRFSPNGADVNGHNGQQAGTSEGQYQNMHLMQNTDTYDQQMPSTSMGPEYNAFEMPTVVTSQTDGVPFQDLVMDDPNSFYLNQQPSTSMANDNGMNDNYDMMAQQPTTYMPQIDQMGGPSSNQQSQPSQEMEVQPAKPKPKKSRPNNKKKQGAGGAMTVGNMLTEVHKMQQKTTTNSGVVVEAQFTPEESMRLPTLLNEIASLQIEIGQGATDKTDMFNILQAELMGLMSRNVGSSTIIDAVQDLRVAAPAPLQAPTPAPLSAPIKKPPPKRNRNPPQKNNVQQNQSQHMQQEMTPTKIMMEPPTTTMVPSSSNSNNNYGNSNDNYGYQQMDQQQGTSQSQYGDYQQPHSQETMHHQGQNQMHGGQMQQMQTKVVPSMNQRTHNYRQQAYFNPNSNGPGPSPQMQPSSHESMHMEQVHQQQNQYHHQEDDGSSQHMYAPHQHEHLQQHQQDDRNMYHQHTPDQMDQGMRRNQGQFQSPQQMRPLVKQQMMHGSLAPTPSPGNLQYGEPMHDNYQQEHHMQSQPQEYDENYGEYFATPQQPGSQMEQMQVHSIHQQYDPQEMYPEIDEPEYEYSYEPEAAPELTKEELDARMEEAREDRQRKVKVMLLEQLDQLEQPADLTPFRGKVDIFNRMVPYHHFTSTEEPVPEFASTSQRCTEDLAHRAHALGSRIRNIVLRDTMRSQTEWEENMLLYLDTETLRRKLAEDRVAAEQDRTSFVQKSEIIHMTSKNLLNLEKTRRAVPPRPAHHYELDVASGQLSQMYKEYEFDSYDENRPKGSPVPFESFVYDPESESEPEPEPEKEEPEQEPLRSDLSPATYTPASPAESVRVRNDSETTGEMEDEDEESPILSPVTDKYAKAAAQLHREMFGDDDELVKSAGLFPIDEEPAEMPRRPVQEKLQTQVPEAVKSSADTSSSTVGSPHKVSRSPSPQPGPSNRVQIPPRSPSPVSCQPSSSTAAAAPAPPPPRMYNRVNSASPEIGDVFFAPIKRVNAADIPPIPLPVPIHKIKKEKEDMPKLSFRVPVSVYEQGVKLANDDDDIQEIPIVTPVREPIKLRIKLTNIKLEEPSPERDEPSTSGYGYDQQPSTFAAFQSAEAATTPRKNVKKEVEKSSEKKEDAKFKVPTPLKTTPTSESRKRRSAKIEDAPMSKKIREETPKQESPKKHLMVTPKNGEVEEERFLRTMTDGRKITMKIGKIPRNINHFVTPRRDGKGNLIKNLSPTPDTRLKMTFRRKNGRLSVEVTEKKEDPVVETPKMNGPTSSQSTMSAPVPKSSPPKPRLAPASRKNSIDAAGKDKRNHITKSKTAYCNNFNPFANVPSSIPSSSSAGPSSSMPSTSSMRLSTPSISTNSATMRPSVQMKTPVARPIQAAPSAAPRAVPRVAPASALRAPAPAPSVMRTAPIVPPKITVSASPVPAKNSLAALLPWMTDDVDEVPDRKPNMALLAPFVASQPSTSAASCSSAPSAPSRSTIKVKIEPVEDPVEPEKPPQDSPRASSSLSIFFEDDKLPFLSPKRPNEPLPVVEFSDDEENDLAHSTFSTATEHLLSTSAPLNNPPNEKDPPFLPWSSDP